MIIEKFCIQNYKSIKKCDFVNLESDLTLLIGQNEAGKTSILKALESFRTGFEYDYNDLAIHSNDRKEYENGNIQKKDIPITTIHFQIESDDRFKLEEIDQSFKNINSLNCTKFFDNHYEIEVPELNLQLKGNLEDESLKEDYISKIKKLAILFKGELDSIISNTHYMNFKEDYDEIIDEIIAFDNFDEFNTLEYNKLRSIITNDEKIMNLVDDFLEQIESYKTKIKTINSETDETFEKILDILPNFMYFSTIDELEYEATWMELKSSKGKYKTLRNLLELSGLNFEKKNDFEDRNFITDVTNASVLVTGLVNESWTQEKIKLNIYVTNEKILISISDDVVKEYFDPSVRSQGFKWFLSFYINFMAGSKKEFKNTIILLDDPGVYLHASGQKDLIKTLEEISKSNQIVISTHSPFMINKDKLERIRVVTRLESEGTIITEKFYKSNFDAFAPIRASIGMNISDSLFIGNKTVVVEGYSDSIILKSMSKFLANNGNNNLDLSKISVLPVNSADKTPYFSAIFLNENIDFIVILDYDEKGKKILNKLKREFDDDIDIVTFNDLENIKQGDLEIEDIIDFEFYFKAFNEAYSEILVNKIGKNLLSKEDITSESFRGLKKYFKINKNTIGDLDKVLIANKINEMLIRDEKPGDETINNFSNLFGLINDKFKN